MIVGAQNQKGHDQSGKLFHHADRRHASPAVPRLGMAAAGDAFSHESICPGQPGDYVRELVVNQTKAFASMGYKVEAHTADTLILIRKFVPRPVYAIPLTIAVIVFLADLAQHGTYTAAPGIAAVCVWVAIGLSLFIRTRERLTFTARPDGSQTRVLISGSATPRLQGYIRSLDPGTDS